MLQLAAGTTDPALQHQQSSAVAAYAWLCTCRERHPDVFRAVPFYPEATIDFSITPDMASQHFHIPLLLNPYGYSTYRGS